MKGCKAIVIAVDGLRASALGAYGNTWHATPALDALAAEAVVVENMWVSSPELAAFYNAAWGEGALLRALSAAGVRTQLVTDASRVAAWADAAGVTEAWALESTNETAAASSAETGLGRLFVLAAERLETWAASGDGSAELLWIHGRGWYGAWDAPRELRARLLDDDDPEPPDFVTPPARVATEDHDELLGFRAAYAAQTIVLDECVGGLQAVLEQLQLADRASVVLVGCRGFALGEHGAVGGEVCRLYGELLHVPCLLRSPGLAPAPPRSTELAAPDVLHASLAEWFEVQGSSARNATGGGLLPVDGAATARRQFLMATGADGERALRTQSWMLRQPPRREGEAPLAELFVKPDDRWEANEVADRCGDVADRLLAALNRAADNDGSAGALDDDLV